MKPWGDCSLHTMTTSEVEVSGAFEVKADS